MNQIERAEDKARQRAMVFYMMAAVLVLMTLTNMGRPADWPRLTLWTLTMVLFAANLTPIAPIWPRGLRRFINDDTTQDHRRSSFAAGFWAAIGSALLSGLVTPITAVAPLDVVRVVVAAALAAALVCFATLELRAQKVGVGG